MMELRISALCLAGLVLLAGCAMQRPAPLLDDLPWAFIDSDPGDVQEKAGETEVVAEESEPLDRWAVEADVTFLSEIASHRCWTGRFNRADGDARGQTYNLRVWYTLHEFDWDLVGLRVRPRLEIPATLGIVDERGRSPFLTYSLGLFFRWSDFPWNRYIHTTAGTAFGIHYTERIVRTDQERHPDEHRSHWKFYWPIQVTFAVPGYERYQFVLFNDHFSSKGVFDEGGYDAWGFGFRFII